MHTLFSLGSGCAGIGRGGSAGSLPIDTNVVVSGLISADPQALACLILDTMLSGRFVYLLSPALLDEYRTVLLRPKIQKLHRLVDEDMDRILAEILGKL